MGETHPASEGGAWIVAVNGFAVEGVLSYKNEGYIWII